MNPETIITMKAMQAMIKMDLDNLTYLIKQKEKEYVKITCQLSLIDVELDMMSEKLIINCDPEDDHQIGE